MVTEVIYTGGITFGETTVTSIKVFPLNFVSFVKLWTDTQNEVRSSKTNDSSLVVMQRKRIILQAQFMAGDQRLKPELANVLQLPLGVAKQIISALDIGEGVAGTLLNDADGISSPIHYKLGTPIAIKVGGKEELIKELEFQASTYGDIEEVLAGDSEVPQALELLRRCATPVGLDSNMKTLPSFALDQITNADGITIMQQVLPNFLK